MRLLFSLGLWRRRCVCVTVWLCGCDCGYVTVDVDVPVDGCVVVWLCRCGMCVSVSMSVWLHDRLSAPAEDGTTPVAGGTSTPIPPALGAVLAQAGGTTGRVGGATSPAAQLPSGGSASALDGVESLDFDTLMSLLAVKTSCLSVMGPGAIASAAAGNLAHRASYTPSAVAGQAWMSSPLAGRHSTSFAAPPTGTAVGTPVGGGRPSVEGLAAAAVHMSGGDTRRAGQLVSSRGAMLCGCVGLCVVLGGRCMVHGVWQW